MQIGVIIPALNEAECLEGLLSHLPAFPDDRLDVIVVDNGSTDATADVARAHSARVVSEPRRGYGYACAAGVRLAEGADVLVFLDGDGSFDPAEMPNLLAPLRSRDADLVLGSRLLGGRAPAMLLHQHFGNWLTVRLMQGLYGLRLTDLGPYRAMRTDFLMSLEMQEMTYGWPTEMIVKAACRRARLVEVPVSYRVRRGGRSKVSGSLAGSALAAYHILRVTFAYGVIR